MTLPAIDSLVRKIVSSRAMARSERLARFLEFTVSETMAGNAGQIKEFVVGVEVFGRTRDYDPRLDPIVRVEARRLRMKLRKYYDTEGRDDRIRIEYPKGSYVPGDLSIPPRRPTHGCIRRTRRAIVVLPFLSQGESGNYAAAVGEGLISALIQMEDLRVVAWNTALRLKATPRDYARLGDQLQVHGVVEGSVRRWGKIEYASPRNWSMSRTEPICGPNLSSAPALKSFRSTIRSPPAWPARCISSVAMPQA